MPLLCDDVIFSFMFYILQYIQQVCGGLKQGKIFGSQVAIMNFTFGKVLDAKNAIPGTRQSGAKFALVVLTCINLLNFADRYVTSAVKELIKEDMNLSDTGTLF